MEKITYSKSLKAKLTLERGFMMESYQTLMDVVNTRKDVLLVQSFYKDRVANGKNKVAIIKGFALIKHLFLCLLHPLEFGMIPS